MKPYFKQLLQIGIIVRDVDAAVKRYEEQFGMGPWKVSFMSGENPPTQDLVVDGKPCPGRLSKMAFLNAYGIEFELIEPIADSPYKTWLEEHGPGIHHIAAVTEDDYEKVLADTKALTGKGPWIRGQGMGGIMDFSYLDLREELGLIVECYKNIHPDRPRVDY
jgi:methylmalonyl-CoA/ethylmalonyl-CoA epimerase